ncbi:uncharacterized protein BYT42DRAFT_592914 [Radiomyces spectabilis]|uniref:uncharacterized protein n=1 Tax=Radiomyces spectabilis TaxID=64574 RepID=UPI0022211042|nr:uncharacterized protein BYT42DRAFT_592914 [Radiomyces spectabilis]KAI8384890.1 hypothetical protein BYT42DRAFT_592914 [Radiomyces spectabilis]
MASVTAATAATANRAVCWSPECTEAAAAILKDIDMNVDPCTDFYQYTSIGTFTTLRSDALKVLNWVLESSYEDVMQLAKNTTGSTAVTDDDEIDQENLARMQRYYRSCMDELTIDEMGPTPMYKGLATMLAPFATVNHSLPLIQPDAIQAFTSAMILLGEDPTEVFIDVSIGTDDQRPDQHSISLGQPSLILPSREYYSDPTMMEKFREQLVNILSTALGEEAPELLANDKRADESSEHELTLLNDEAAKSLAERIVKLETRLAELMMAKQDILDPISSYNPMSLSQIEQQYPIMNWTAYFRHFVPSSVDVPSRFIVTTPKYLDRLTAWFQSGELTVSDVKDYLLVRMMLHKAVAVDNVTRSAVQGLNAMLSGTVNTLPKRSRTCTKRVSENFGQLMGRYFVMLKFGGEDERNKVGQFLDLIHGAWLDRLALIDWLDEKTRQKAIEKVNAIRHKAAYNIQSPDVRSPASLRDYFSGIDIDEQSFYENERSSAAWQVRNAWRRIGQPVDKSEWFMTPHEVNAYYSPSFNEIVIPSGILRPPFYYSSSDALAALNYGGVGVVIGHELTHAFDDSGRLYDAQGRLMQWWTNDTTAQFEEKSQCFVSQYSNFTVEGPNQTMYHVNGKMTLGENLADNGGLSAAWMAFQRQLANHGDTMAMRLPGLEHLSPEALFFINFGRVWCGQLRPEMAVQKIHVDVHSPARVRVNAAVQNSVEFAQTFQCASGTPMNPDTKCRIW